MGKRKHTFESAKQYFEDNNCQLISTSYDHCDAYLDYICNCGGASRITYNEFRHGKRCKNCKSRKISDKRRRPFDDVKKSCENLGFEVLTTNEEYASWDFLSNNKIKLKCSNGHISYKRLANLIGSKRKSCLLCYRGENHHFYIDGRGFDPSKNRHGDTCNLYRPWKRDVHKRDGWKWDVENRYNVDNGVTLCYEHHENFHKIYGQSDNTKEQFNQYRAIIEECQPILEGQIGIPLLILSIN